MKQRRKLTAIVSAFALVFTMIFSGFPAMAAMLGITGIQVSEVSPNGYRVTIQFIAEAGVREVLMPSWSDANGQDDVKWHRAGVSGNQATCYIPVSEHNYGTGSYTTHIYLYDNYGQMDLKGTQAVVPAAAQSADPVITDIRVTEVTSAGYRVTAELYAPGGVSKVEMPTWTDANNQDDLVWHQAAINSSRATFYVPVSAHKNESGKYITHIYLYDHQGRRDLKGIDVIVPAAGGATGGNTGNTGNSGNTGAGNGTFSVGPITVTEVTADGYKVTAALNSSNGISKVEMPTWTEANHQDDLIWHQASVNGNTAVFYVRVSDHKNESGKYITHVYLYDNAGKETLAGVEVTVPARQTSNPIPVPSEMTISNVTISEVTSAGYRVTAIVNAPNGISKVQMPTWTEANGQDDVVWHQASVNGNSATCYIKASDHKNESGRYVTHIYLHDQTGKEILTGTEAVVPALSGGNTGNTGSTGNTGTSAPPVISRVTVSEITTAGYRVTAQISAPAGVSKVEMAAWSDANGQDDVVWHPAAFNSNTATCYISAARHNNESGSYTTHVYLYDNAGEKVIAGVQTTIPSVSGGGLPTGGNAGKLTLSIPFITSLNSTGYTIQVTFSAPMGAQRIAAAVWTAANGNDDLVWHEMEIIGDRAVVRIPISAHNNEHGIYTTNVYLFDATGASVMTDAHVPVP